MSRAHDSLSRKQTAQLLKRLRELARETRMLKAEIDAAKQDALTSHAKSVDPERARSRT